ncbi:hypothetical protein PC129_g10143 [Phytophthora cactorum]|uniref:Uncharacterized protein n=1 Tax=Phytophthora cactorum TaxID=29920 RepID=A0A329S8U7_9STRA|nr:hypothetical protein Pcac1_g231 [Phytophthora cactorum]KAG3219067.1 hypothetical protein PC129_g10143 [Phytophthora cactorum]RAW31982.1 hypothetical protein PC110_g11675 [Phytophthora cactorum]
MRGESQRLSAHLKAAYAEIERLRIVYSHAIEQLEVYALSNLSPQSAAQWYEMYLRVVDLGVQIRRGEIRHRTTQRFKYPCMHKTGTKGAVHSGLSIDDGNGIFQLIENGNLVKESWLEKWFGKMDILDRDVIGLLDKRVTRCLEDFRRQRSVFYDRLETTGKDPHEKMVVFGAPGAASLILAKVTRTCFGPKNCSCKEDAAPWEDFCLKSGDPHVQKLSSPEVAGTAVTAQVNDVGIMDIKRQMGFEELSREEKREDTAALARDAAELARRRIPRRQNSAVAGGQSAPPSARSIYQKKCEENGSKPKRHLTVMLAVKKGSHYLNLSDIGFHSADDLQILVDIFSTTGLPPVKELDMSNGFFNAEAFQMLCQLLRVTPLRQSIERLSLRSIAVPARADFATLMQILTSEPSSSFNSLPALGNLKTLDLSFNTLSFEGGAQLQPLLSSLQRLEDLSLESCFPEPVLSFESSIDRKATEESVRGALAGVSNRLERLNFGLNYAAIESRWLDALFAPGNTFQKLDLYGMSSSSTESSGTPEPMGVDWQAGEAWDLQQVETLKSSSSCVVYSEKLLGALCAELQSGFAQLKHLDIEVNIGSGHGSGNQMDKKVGDAIMRIADYGVLRSCRIGCYTRSVISDGMSASIARLLEDGLHECEVLTLRMPQLYLQPPTLHEILSGAVVSKMRKMTLAVGITCGGQAQPNFSSCFLQMRTIQELTLEFHVAIEEQSNAFEGFGAFARELEASWLGLSLSAADMERHDQSAFGRTAGKLNRSFLLSEQQKATKRIYRCRFLTNPTS